MSLRESYIEFIKKLKSGHGFWENGRIVNNDAAIKQKTKELNKLL